jgi:UDP-GlcNAc:undecaprenyl-phosphate GlcNAc-1-phosphate transferase
MTLLVDISFFFTLLCLEFIYFTIADRFNIIDSPNHRSSHTKVTLRGGGIIFIPGFFLSWLFWGHHYTYVMVGLFLIGCISFIDDIKPVSKLLRISIHFVGAALLLYQLGLYTYPFYWVLIAFVFVITTINGTNFMDGINGITGGYSLLIMLTLLYINKYRTSFTTDAYLIGPIAALLVFNFFNFRKNARCFAGDVGSVSIAFLVAFFLLQLIIKSNDLSYLLLLLVYIIDTITTIFFRLIKKENIFEPHRSHYYQFLANERGMPHLGVASMYVAFQILINVSVICLGPVTIVNFAIILILSTIGFIFIRLITEGRQRLLDC